MMQVKGALLIISSLVFHQVLSQTMPRECRHKCCECNKMCCRNLHICNCPDETSCNCEDETNISLPDSEKVSTTTSAGESTKLTEKVATPTATQVNSNVEDSTTTSLPSLITNAADQELDSSGENTIIITVTTCLLVTFIIAIIGISIALYWRLKYKTLSINLQTNASYNVNSATTDGQPEDPLYSVIDDPTTTSQQTAHRAHTALVPVPYHQEIERDGTVGALVPADYEQPLNSLRTSPQKQHEKDMKMNALSRSTPGTH